MKLPQPDDLDCKTAAKSGVPDATSVYDAAGLRVAECVNDVWRFLIYDIGGRLVAEYGGVQPREDLGRTFVNEMLTSYGCFTFL